MTRNVILVTAPSSGGKTSYIQALQSVLSTPKHEFISDLDAIRKAVILDHRQAFGTNHTHPEQVAQSFGFTPNSHKGHDHKVKGETPTFPFIATSNYIRDHMFSFFWQDILMAPKDVPVFAELACGANQNPPESKFATPDFSYKTLIDMFHAGALPRNALDRIAFCLHPETTIDTRLFRSHLRNDRPTEVTLIFARDDFSALGSFLRRAKVPILSFDNNLHIEKEGDRARYLMTEMQQHGILEQISRSDTEGGNYFRRV